MRHMMKVGGVCGAARNRPRNERREHDMKANFILWLKAAAVRAVKTLAQTAVATIGTTAMLSEVDWVLVASASALAGILSILTSVAGLPEVKEE